MDAIQQALQPGRAITGKDGVLTSLIKKLTEAALEGELDTPRLPPDNSLFPPMIYKFAAYRFNLT